MKSHDRPKIVELQIWSIIDENTTVFGFQQYSQNLPNDSVQDFLVATNFTNSSTLIINPVDYEDFGLYVCVGILTNDSSGINMDVIEISNTSTVTGNNKCSLALIFEFWMNLCIVIQVINCIGRNSVHVYIWWYDDTLHTYNRTIRITRTVVIYILD